MGVGIFNHHPISVPGLSVYHVTVIQTTGMMFNIRVTRFEKVYSLIYFLYYELLFHHLQRMQKFHEGRTSSLNPALL